MIYKGTLKSLYVKDLEITEKGVILALDLDSVVVEKDSLFYKNFIGKLINFEHRTFLPSVLEAESYVRDACRRNPYADSISCLYADYSSITPVEEEKRTVKELKKVFRENRKKR